MWHNKVFKKYILIRKPNFLFSSSLVKTRRQYIYQIRPPKRSLTRNFFPFKYICRLQFLMQEIKISFGHIFSAKIKRVLSSIIRDRKREIFEKVFLSICSEKTPIEIEKLSLLSYHVKKLCLRVWSIGRHIKKKILIRNIIIFIAKCHRSTIAHLIEGRDTILYSFIGFHVFWSNLHHFFGALHHSPCLWRVQNSKLSEPERVFIAGSYGLTWFKNLELT